MLELSRSMLRNPIRVKRLIHEAISSLNLDLSGLTVLTEAASNNFVVTPIIAAMAKARTVYALTADSKYGKAKDIAEFTYQIAEFCQVRDNIEVVFKKSREIVSQADIVTNLGFVRPINNDMISMMKEGAVIPLMHENCQIRVIFISSHYHNTFFPACV